MGRSPGVRNQASDARRRDLLRRMRDRLGRVGATHASWRELAAAAEVSLATLNHHFGKRDAVIRAILEASGEEGRAPLAEMAVPRGSFAESVPAALRHLAAGLERGVGEMLAVGLVEGLRQPGAGAVFVEASLEPVIAAVASRLVAHQGRGEMRAADPRIAAIGLVAPLILAHLHQQELGGAASHPLALDDLVAQTAAAFVRAYRMDADGPGAPVPADGT